MSENLRSGIREEVAYLDDATARLPPEQIRPINGRSAPINFRPQKLSFIRLLPIMLGKSSIGLNALANEKQAGTVGFVLTILQRRLHAIEVSVVRHRISRSVS